MNVKTEKQMLIDYEFILNRKKKLLLFCLFWECEKQSPGNQKRKEILFIFYISYLLL